MDINDIQSWLGLICQVGTLVFAALTYFKKKISRCYRLNNRSLFKI